MLLCAGHCITQNAKLKSLGLGWARQWPWVLSIEKRKSQNQAHHWAAELRTVSEPPTDGVLFSKLYFETLKLGLCLSVSGDEPGLRVHDLRWWTRVKYRCIVLWGIRAAAMLNIASRKMYLHTCWQFISRWEPHVCRQLQSSYCEILDSLSAEALPDLLIFIHSIHTPVRAYKLQIFLIWKLLRFMTPLAIYFARSRRLCNQLTLKKKAQIITVQILSCIVTICSPSKGCWEL